MGSIFGAIAKFLPSLVGGLFGGGGSNAGPQQTNVEPTDDGGGGIGNVLGSIGGWAADNPIAILSAMGMLGSIPGGSAQRKLTGAQRLLLEEQLKKMQRNAGMNTQAQAALGRMFSAGPYSRSMPDVSDLFGGQNNA